MENSSMGIAFLILLAIILIGIIFDIIGVAVTSADEKPFHSMAARKVPGSQEAIKLLRNAERVSSICNDVIGDICGVVSGSAAATIAAHAFTATEIAWPQLLMSALVAGFTVGGKAIGKTFAINSCTQIVYFAGRVSWFFGHIPDLFKKKNK
jgi:CBS domain containing-hemolysin-like protein